MCSYSGRVLIGLKDKKRKWNMTFLCEIAILCAVSMLGRVIAITNCQAVKNMRFWNGTTSKIPEKLEKISCVHFFSGR